VERSPHGRHTAGQTWQAVARARSWKSTKASRSVWVVVLGAVTALVAAAITFGGGNQTAVFAANSSSAPLMGVSVGSSAILAQDRAEFGQLPIVRLYYPGMPSSNAWTTGLPAQAKSAVVVSFKAQPSAILSGADNAALSHFFDTAPTGHPIYYSFYHEPENNIAAGQFTASAYRAAWAHVVALADAAHNPDLHSILILMAYDLKPASHRNWRDYMPSGGIISTLGWDAYPAGAAGGGKLAATPPAQFMGPEVAASKAAGLPFGFAEFGLPTSVGRAEWLNEVGNYLMTSGALFGTLFDSSAVSPSMQLTDSASISVWRSFVAKSGTIAPVPAPSPTVPPVHKPIATPPPAATSPTAPGVTGLALSPAALTASGQNHTTVTFRLTQAADVTVLVLNSKGTVVRTLMRPTCGAGTVAIRYFGYNGGGVREPTGSYQVLVVASNANGSGTAETPLTINGPM
jgi:hypothetical protein